MRFVNFAIVKFSFFLVLGILTAHYFPIPFLILTPLVVVLSLVFVFWLLARQQLIQQVYLGIAAYLCFFAIGIFSYQIRLPEFQPNHFSKIILDNSPKILQIKITQTLKPDRFNHKYFAEVNAINGIATSGKVLINIAKDSLLKPLVPDNVVLTYTTVSEISKPQNPHQFDYSNYMKLQGVYGQLRISSNEILKVSKDSKTIFGIAQNLRAEIIRKLERSKLEPDERAIIQALVLGEKKDIDKNLYEAYAAAGAVHILAVSGLHVGILYIILGFLFKPVKRLKYGIVLHSILIVLLLWCFAVLSSLSPSVTRAVTMFSFFAFANLLNRRTNSTNTLFLSLLTLLIINPLWLFQVGFQLSYLAVFFIVWLLPIFKGIGHSKYWLVRKTGPIVGVTICAQIGVLPLSLYYFHQFPGLFLLTNIVVLPFLTILMCGGILIVLLAVFNSLPNWLSEIYNRMIEGLNTFINWVAMQDEFLFEEIHFSALKVIAAYLLIISIALAVKKLNYQRLIVSLVAVSLILTVFIYDEFSTSTNHLIVFHKSRKTLISHKNGKKLTVYKDDLNMRYDKTYPIKSFKTAVNISHYSEEKLPKIFRYNRKNILILDSLGVFPKQSNIHAVILTGSPKVNLVRLIDSLNPKQIIADGSNYRSYIKRWENTCKLKKLPFAYTAEQGAFSIE